MDLLVSFNVHLALFRPFGALFCAQGECFNEGFAIQRENRFVSQNIDVCRIRNHSPALQASDMSRDSYLFLPHADGFFA